MRKFIIVGTPRTGTSALAQIINFQPAIACGWQWTASVPWWRKITAAQRGLQGDFDALPPSHRAHMLKIVTGATQQLGFRMLFRSSDRWLLHPRLSPALWFDRLEQHLRWLASEADTAVIHIQRDDNIAWLKSYLLSRLTNLYIGKPYPEGLTVKINAAEAAARIRSKNWLNSRLIQLENSNPYLRVEYEEMCRDMQATGEIVLQFLGCQLDGFKVDAAAMDAKQARTPTHEGIENYAEIVRKLTKNGLCKTAFAPW